MPTGPINTFIEAVRSRLNRAELLRSLVALVLIGAGLAILWAVAWRIGGYAAPGYGYAIAAAGALVLAGVLHYRRRHDRHRAAHTADVHFSLKDGLLSFLEFEQHADEVFQLQRTAVSRQLAGLTPAALPLRFNRRAAFGAGLLALVAIGLALLPPSQAVRDKLALQQLTLDRTAEIKRELTAAVEETIVRMDEKEREVLKPESLREWIKDINGTKDQREAMKQLARFEQKLSEAMRGLETRKDEEILKLAAAELGDSKVSEAKQLGKKLDAKDFENAAKDLNQMKPGEIRKPPPEELAALQQKSAKLREMTQRMANAPRRRDFGKNPKPGDLTNPANAKDAKPLDEMLDELDQAAGAMDKQLAEAGEADPDGEKMQGMAGQKDKLDGKLDQLGARLGKLDAKQKARARMKGLSQCAGQAQQFAAGQTQSLGLAQQMQAGLGGLKPGTGHQDGKRDARDAATDNGNLAQLNGQQGQGPSTSSVEQADSGSGAAGRGSAEKTRDFRKQVESLVHRDDIPEELKQGVREYFERVHELDDK